MTVTWTSGYNDAEARPIVVWKWEDEAEWKTSLASTVTYEKSDMCGMFDRCSLSMVCITFSSSMFEHGTS